jgi:hypothetical protein
VTADFLQMHKHLNVYFLYPNNFLARVFYLHRIKMLMQRENEVEQSGFAEIDEESKTSENSGHTLYGNIMNEQPFSNNPETLPVNGSHNPDDEDEDEEEEEDLILGDGDEALGNEEEFDVELDEDFDEEDIDEDDLVIDTDDDDDDEDDDL